MEQKWMFEFTSEFGNLYHTYFTLIPKDVLDHFNILAILQKLCFPYYSDVRREINSFIYVYKRDMTYNCLNIQTMLNIAPPARHWEVIDTIGNAETKFFLYSFYKFVANTMELYDNDIENVDIIDFKPEARVFMSTFVPIVVSILTNFGKPLQKNSHILAESPRRNLHLYLQHCQQTEALTKVKQFYQQDKRAEQFIPSDLR